MISDNYIQNILDRSDIVENEINGQYLMGVVLPNKFFLNVIGRNRSECISHIKFKISELETYLERDKVYYNYDLEDEFINE